MTNRLARSAAAITVAAAALLTSACIVPPSLPAPEATPDPAQTQAPVETQAPVATEEPVETAAVEPRYEIVADGQDGSTWSFEVADVRVVEEDSLGETAEPGRQLIEVTVDGQLLAGEPDFYHAFHVYVVDGDGGQWGLSSGTTFYAEDDLFHAGQEPDFSGVGIYQVPAGMSYDVVRFATDDGWSQDVQW
ncbi:hypothetical protein [Agrococcus sp. Ld7]|uniref:hypothetical protein n=1 Tax=Agrococcus sp. Ld7 TaxID=649148 RepID=UPI00386F6A9F